MDVESSGYSPSRIFFFVIIGIVVIGFAGYWYGSRNPGGFAVGPSPINNVLQIDQESAKDHPGSVSMNVNSGLQEYKNDFIGLTFQFPLKWVVEDKWPGDASDLKISGNTLQRQADINSGKISADKQFPQFEIIYSSSISALDRFQLGVSNLDQFIQAYSKEHTELLGATDQPQFKNSQKIAIGDLDGYVADNSDSNGGGKIYFVESSKGFYQVTFRPDEDMNDANQQTILSNLRFN